MKKQILISFLVALFAVLPNIVEAQFFARQQILVWDIYDRVEDVKLGEGVKAEIRSKMEEALTKSQNYDVYTDITNIRGILKSKGLPATPINVANEARKKGINYVIITTLKILERGQSYEDYKVQLASDFMSTETQKTERSAYVDLYSRLNEVPSACSKLLTDLLREQINFGGQSTRNQTYSQQNYSNQNQTYQQPQGNYGYSNGYGQQQPTYQQRSQNYTETVEGINMQMVYVEGGSFIMGATEEQRGDADSDESPSHRVTLDSYYIGAFEVTQAQWRAIMGNNPSYFTGDNNPVEKVSWHDAQAFCQELSNLTGRTYMLPTEAQWEYAARGGNKSRKNKYSGSFAIDVVAWYTSNSGSKTHPVGGKRANELGLYDMSGNVWEWCNDWYGSYSSSPQTNPTGPSSGQYRVLRGGSWDRNASYCRVSNRGNGTPSYVDGNRGFRVVCLP